VLRFTNLKRAKREKRARKELLRDKTVPSMHRIRLIHWNAAEARERALNLRSAGYAVERQDGSGPQFLRKLRERPPDAVVIDLSRLPSHGRDIGLVLRQMKATRNIPLIFVEGDPEKVARIRGLLPDAVYTTWRNIGSSLKHAIAHPPSMPVNPKSVFEAYSDTPLVKKLGIKPNSVVALANAPHDFAEKLGDLPDGVTVRTRTSTRCDLTIWFNKSRKELRANIGKMAVTIGKGRLWIAWPKKGTSSVSDLTQQDVREIGLAAGLVDFKICSIDERWSGLLFTRRRK
jgi:CheY-like chemotaxis protein